MPRYWRRRSALGVLPSTIVFVAAVAGAVGVEVLAPQQELDRVPAGGDVLLAAALVQARQIGLRDQHLAVVDDAAVGLALDVVDVGLVDRPGVDAALGTLVVVDRATVEAKRLRLAVPLTCVEPRLARSAQAVGRGLRHEGPNGALQCFGLRQRVLVAGMHLRRVLAHDGVDGVALGLRGEGRASDGEQHSKGGEELAFALHGGLHP